MHFETSPCYDKLVFIVLFILLPRRCHCEPVTDVTGSQSASPKKPSPEGEGVTANAVTDVGQAKTQELSPHQSKIKDFCQLLPKEKP